MLALRPNTAILPNRLKHYVKLPYLTHSNNIKRAELLELKLDYDSKKVVFFIGGFCDTFSRVMFNFFVTATKRDFTLNDESGFNVGYLSFYCYEFLNELIPALLNDGYEVSIISHSWGAKNSLRFLFNQDLPLKVLITLDCVCRFSIKERPKELGIWENIYIENRILSDISNIVSIIGGAKNAISVADSNISVSLPARHASVRLMLEKSNIFHLKD